MKIYIIAGEPSGDLIGGRIMEALKKHHSSIVFKGVGGTCMTQAGLSSLFPMTYLSVMGLIEIIPHLPRLLKCLKHVVDDIHHTKPDLILTIDAPAFTYRVAKRVKSLGIPLYHVTAPTVWAWRAGRAKAMARLFDHLFCLFPFEPPYFHKEGLQTTFIGHPLTTLLKTHQRAYDPHGPLILLPGSRTKELDVFIPLFQDLLDHHPELKDQGLVIPTIPPHEDRIRQAFKSHKAHIVTQTQKYTSMAKGRLALAASGTTCLELGLLGIPMIVGYKVNPLTAFLIKKLLYTKDVCLINIILNKNVVPELLQKTCTADSFYQEIIKKEWTTQLHHLPLLRNQLIANKDAAVLVAETIIQQTGHL